MNIYIYKLSSPLLFYFGTLTEDIVRKKMISFVVLFSKTKTTVLYFKTFKG